MKTAEQIADELWAKYRTVVKGDHFDETYMGKCGFELALHEYGAAVRQRAVAECHKAYPHPPGLSAAYNYGRSGAVSCAAAIERMELP